MGRRAVVRVMPWWVSRRRVVARSRSRRSCGRRSWRRSRRRPRRLARCSLALALTRWRVVAGHGVGLVTRRRRGRVVARRSRAVGPLMGRGHRCMVRRWRVQLLDGRRRFGQVVLRPRNNSWQVATWRATNAAGGTRRRDAGSRQDRRPVRRRLAHDTAALARRRAPRSHVLVARKCVAMAMMRWRYRARPARTRRRHGIRRRRVPRAGHRRWLRVVRQRRH